MPVEEELQGALQRVSGTTLDAQGAANVWAGTTGLDLLGALNAKAGTTGLGALAAIRAITGGAESLAGYAGAPPVTNVLSLPGTSGNYVSTPDSVANSPTGDMDFRIRLSMPDWTPAAEMYLMAKGNFSGSTISHRFNLHDTSTGTLEAGVHNSSGVESGTTSSASPGYTDGTAHWIRFTFQRVDGASSRIIFYKSDDGVAWTQISSHAVTQIATVRNSTGPLMLGAVNSGTAAPLNAKIYYAELRDGIGGTVVASFDATAVTKLGTRNPTTYTAPTGEVWTVNGTGWDWVAP